MANKGPAYGLSRECAMKTAAKFDFNLAFEAIDWIEHVTEIPLVPSSGDFTEPKDFQEVLKDGQVLCELMIRLAPDLIKKYNKSQLAFKQMENIEVFVNACKKYGMADLDTFQTQDLYEGKSLYSVINCIHTLGSLAQKNGYRGPTIGVKLADKNKRSFSEAQLNEGKNVISLQYGTNQVASQSGMTAYGMTRHM